jgi:hypothetical protein
MIPLRPVICLLAQGINVVIEVADSPPRVVKAMQLPLHDVRELSLQILQRLQKDRTLWDKVGRLAEAFLPTPRICRSWPALRRNQAS